MAKIAIQNADKIDLDILIDDIDFDRVNKYKWVLDSHGKPYTPMLNGNKAQMLYLSRYIHKLKIGDPRLIRYVSKDYLNNHRQNLKMCAERINRRTQASSRGYIWPFKVADFRAFIEEQPEKDFLSFKSNKDIVLNLIDTAIEIKWNIRRIEFKYLKTEDYKAAKQSQSQGMFTRALAYYYDWDFKFFVTGLSRKEDIIEEVAQEEEEEEEEEEIVIEAAGGTATIEEKDDAEELSTNEEIDKPKEQSLIVPSTNNFIEETPIRTVRSKHLRPEYDLTAIPLENLIQEIKQRGVEVQIIF